MQGIPPTPMGAVEMKLAVAKTAIILEKPLDLEELARLLENIQQQTR